MNEAHYQGSEHLNDDFCDDKEKKVLREFEKNFKCSHRFSESTMISANADIYRPKSA